MFIRKRILVVDGEDRSRSFLRFSLTNAGYIIETVNNAEDGMKMAMDEDFDAFFVDIHLPDLSGIKLIKALREIEDYLETPILAMTPANIEKFRKKGEALGISAWVSKPIAINDILELLRSMKLTNTQTSQNLF